MKYNEIMEAFASMEKPVAWEYCFHGNCSQKEDCLRYIVANYLPLEKDSGGAVYPNAVRSGQCDYYLKPRVERLAWGFGKLFDNVLAKDSVAIRHSLYAVVGYKRKYSRYNTGEYKLTEEQQKQFAEVFKRYGYSDELEFEHYEDSVDLGIDSRQCLESGKRMLRVEAIKACPTVGSALSQTQSLDRVTSKKATI